MSQLTPSNGRLAILATTWALASAVIAALCWGIFGATIYPLLSGSTLREILHTWPLQLLGTLYLAAPVALGAFPEYALLLFAWLCAARRWQGLEATRLRVIGSAFVLAVPVGIAFFIGYLAPTGSLGPFWRESMTYPPIILLCTWIGLLLPRLTLRRLHPRYLWVAA
jgi:hypothetical protein